MRNLVSWLSMAFYSVVAQIQTFVFCGLACGYAFGVYAYLKLMRYEFIPSEIREAAGHEGPPTGVYLEQWGDFYQAVRAGEIEGLAQQMPIVGWYFLAGFAVGACVFVLIVNVSTIYHLRRLAKGVDKLVDDLGAEPLLSYSDAGKLTLIPRVVHELSIEFGVAAPELFLLPEEEGINAFVAGRKRSEAILVVTHGLRHLNETQLRGLIAHEMAHLSNGDMIHNMRLLALELGVNSVRHTAEWLLRTGWNFLTGPASHHRVALWGIQYGCLMLLFGMMVWPMGLISSCAGAAAMAMNNRRRELRADKLAAKILGSWEPIAEALKRIAGHNRSGRISGVECRKLGHMMFAQANGSSGGLFGSHPRMNRRIKSADRSWDGIPIYENEDEDFVDPSQLVDVEKLEALLTDLDSAKLDVFRSSDSATIATPAILLFGANERSLAQELLDPEVAETVEMLWQCVDPIDDKQRFALTELAFATARKNESDNLKNAIRTIDAGLPEQSWHAWFWTQVFVDAILEEQVPTRVTMRDCRGCEFELAEIFSLAVSLNSGGGAADSMQELKFQRLWMSTGMEQVEYIPPDYLSREHLSAAVEKLSHLPKAKLKLLIKCIVDLYQSQTQVSGEQASLLRYLSARWDITTPEPPFTMVCRSVGEAQLSFTR